MSKRDEREGGGKCERASLSSEREIERGRRERAYEGSCKTRLKTQDGFLNGLLER